MELILYTFCACIGGGSIGLAIGVAIEYLLDSKLEKKRAESLDKLTQTSQDMGMYDD